MKATERLPFALIDLNPRMILPITELIITMNTYTFTAGGTDYRFEPFEGYRTPMRQNHLLAGGKVTKAGPFQSAHQYGLAVDFACRAIDQMGQASGWHWPEGIGWDELKRRARGVGLDVPIAWDRGHVEHPLFKEIRRLG